MGGQDGTNAQSLLTDTNGQLRTIGPVRTRVSITYNAVATATGDTMLSLVKAINSSAAAGTVSVGVTSGKTLRIIAITVSAATGSTSADLTVFNFRTAASSPVSTSSTIEWSVALPPTAAVSGDAQAFSASFPDGLEFTGTQVLGVSANAVATTTTLRVAITGFEY